MFSTLVNLLIGCKIYRSQSFEYESVDRMRLVPLVPGLVMVLGFSVASCYPSHLMTPVDTSLTEFLENMKDNILKSRDLKDRQIRDSWYFFV